ncbi:MAG: ribonuclease III family protein, partial [Clostridia bacterium]|nr:ribonuclease III family protein [Clostridia bacterium]
MNDQTITKKDFFEIEEIIGYAFQDKTLLKRCFTLSSASDVNNERLEFLGDALLEAYVSGALYRYSNFDEGTMTKLRQNVVSDDNLRQAVEGMGLEKYLVYTGKRENLGRKPIASLFEALTAGIYLDGGMQAAGQFIAAKLLARHKGVCGKSVQEMTEVNHKGVLQEYLQGRGFPRAEYAVTGR